MNPNVVEVKKEIELEIAHVLFLDIVGYSKLSVNEQHARVEELNETVRLCEQFRKAEAASRLLKIPTGDDFLQESGGTGPVCGGDQPRTQEQRAPASSDGHSQWTGQWCGRRDRTHQRSWGRRQHGPASDGLRRLGTHHSVLRLPGDLGNIWSAKF